MRTQAASPTAMANPAKPYSKIWPSPDAFRPRLVCSLACRHTSEVLDVKEQHSRAVHRSHLELFDLLRQALKVLLQPQIVRVPVRLGVTQSHRPGSGLEPSECCQHLQLERSSSFTAERASSRLLDARKGQSCVKCCLTAAAIYKALPDSSCCTLLECQAACKPACQCMRPGSMQAGLSVDEAVVPDAVSICCKSDWQPDLVRRMDTALHMSSGSLRAMPLCCTDCCMD